MADESVHFFLGSLKRADQSELVGSFVPERQRRGLVKRLDRSLGNRDEYLVRLDFLRYSHSRNRGEAIGEPLRHGVGVTRIPEPELVPQKRRELHGYEAQL